MVERLTVEPESEPVSLAEVKTQLSLETAEDDAFLEQVLIPAARRHVEAHCNRGIVQQTWEAVLDAFPCASQYARHSCFPTFSGQGACKVCQLYIELPHGQLATLVDDDPAVESIKYIDLAGDEQILDTDEYSIDTLSVPGRVHLAYGKSWPQARKQWDAVKITYVVGWEADAVPEPIKQAMLLLISQMYEHRVPEITGTIINAVKFSYEALLSPYRIHSL
jgi:hypothetical protein